MDAPKHTALPWSFEAEGADYAVRGANGELLILDTCYYPSAPFPEDAAFIVRAVNSHDDLVEALEAVVTVSASGADTVSFLVELHRVAKLCAAALSKAKGEA